MTIDEAIEYYSGMTKFYKSDFNKKATEKCNQIADWLEELKDLRKWKEQEEKACDRFYQQGRADVIESTYYVIKPLMSIEEWTSRVNYQLQLGLKEQRE